MKLWYRYRGLRAGRRERPERAVVGEPAVHAEAWTLVVEPGEEGHLLRVVGEAAQRVVERRSGQRVAHLEVGLAAADLADVAPRRCRVDAVGVVLPFAHLVGEGGDVRRSVENAGVVVHRQAVGLHPRRGADGVVVAEHAALAA